MRADPLVQAVLARFPGAEIVDVREGGPVVREGVAAGDSEDVGRALDDDGSGLDGEMRPDDEL